MDQLKNGLHRSDDPNLSTFYAQIKAKKYKGVTLKRILATRFYNFATKIILNLIKDLNIETSN